jgi:hypothetical protein
LLLAVLALVIGLNTRCPARYRRWLIASALWFVLTVGVMFVVNLVVPVYGLRYVITILPGLALLIGVSVFHLRRFWARAATLAIILLTGVLAHDSVFDYLLMRAPHRELLQTIAANFQPGDKIWYNLSYGARGSTLRLGSAYHLEYDTPELRSDDFVWNAPRDYVDIVQVPRVWDVRPYWVPMPEDAQSVLTAERFVTEKHTIRDYGVRLYEAPPVDQPVYTFGDTFEVAISNPADSLYAPGETIDVRTWWRSLEIPPVDYSFGLYLRNGTGEILAQADGELEIDGKPTSQWRPSNNLAPDILPLVLPPDLAAGTYELLLGTYYWENPVRLPVSGGIQQQINTELALLHVADVHVQRG